jgi:hypothetical protein
MEKYILLTTAVGALDAEIYRASLEAAGIPVLVSQESVGSTYGLTIGSLGSVEILVPESRLDEALEIINSGSVEDISTGEGDPND